MSNYDTPKEGNFGISPWSLGSLILEFDLKIDYAAEEKNKSLARYYGPDNPDHPDAFQETWTENGWLNPDYEFQEKWVRHAIAQVRCNRNIIVMLLRADTSAIYFQEKLMGIDQLNHKITLDYNIELRYIAGRIPFWVNGEKPKGKNRPMFASAVGVLSPK